MKEFLSIIRTASLFTGIRDPEIVSMLRCLNGKTAEYAKGDYVLRAGDAASSIGLLLSGRALVIQEDFWGNRNIISSIQPGSIFAESFACSPGTALTISVVTETPSAVLFLDVNRILTTCPSTCSHHTQIIQNLVSDLANKNLRFNEKMTHMSQRSTRQKLLSYFSAEARRHGGHEFDIPFTRQQLADYLSVDRSGLSAELCKMRDEGILSFHRSHFNLHRIETR